jgi:hypothetical protein
MLLVLLTYVTELLNDTDQTANDIFQYIHRGDGCNHASGLKNNYIHAPMSNTLLSTRSNTRMLYSQQSVRQLTSSHVNCKVIE